MSDNQVSHGELVQRFADALEGLDSKAMVNLWNSQFDDEVRYLGDSMYEFLKEKPSDASKYLTSDELQHGFPNFQKAIERRKQEDERR